LANSKARNVSSCCRRLHEPIDNPDWLLACVAPFKGEQCTCYEANAKLRLPRLRAPFFNCGSCYDTAQRSRLAGAHIRAILHYSVFLSLDCCQLLPCIDTLVAILD